eukprot:CAMPEP_0171248040 /NCGR_PEP_ID=MMETSP0790-20130122/48811_1 /TAXON_ID=2925 /ORGANISM="Alexandrium catenella, Strain OF101" /LENGTH=186 /DNA_ID=CAMNT_0011715479 /DNA_START=56 /DNA_END=612 /DNA_ORIENTATION=+
MALAYEGRLAIVDFMKLESSTVATEVRGKELVRRIMEARHILKVVHGLKQDALQALQRAAVPRVDLVRQDAPALPKLTPVLDLAVVMAFTHRSRPLADAASKLVGLSFYYLRVELCNGECLSNFERRPLRETQKHFALSLAWCPLMILKALCAHGIVERTAAMVTEMGAGPPPDDLLMRVNFNSDG